MPIQTCMGLVHLTHCATAGYPSGSEPEPWLSINLTSRCNIPCLPCSSPGIKIDKSYDCGYAVPILASFPTGLKEARGTMGQRQDLVLGLTTFYSAVMNRSPQRTHCRKE